MLNKVNQLMKKKEYKQAQELLIKLLEREPANPEIHYQIASVHDVQGEEKEAIPYYESALKMDIQGEQRQETFIQLGSSYRCIGNYEKAKSTLLKGLEEFPENPALKVFLAMTLYNLHQEKDAVAMLLNTIAVSGADPWIQKYGHAIKFYAENLDEVW